jgi:hypothetical protein
MGQLDNYQFGLKRTGRLDCLENALSNRGGLPPSVKSPDHVTYGCALLKKHQAPRLLLHLYLGSGHYLGFLLSN